MTWREMFWFWLTAEHPDQRERDRKINSLLTAIYILTREALVRDMECKKDEARALRTAINEIERLVREMDAAGVE